MKILHCIIIATLGTAALQGNSQTLPNGNNGLGAIKSARAVEALAAITHALTPQAKHFSRPESILSGSWVREWNLTKSWSKGAWENMVQNTFTYDIYGNQLSQLGQSWENAVWKNSLLQTWTYDEEWNEITHTSQIWNGSTWSGTAVDTEIYNANGERTSLLSRYLSGSTWVNQYLYTYTYDAHGNLTTDLCQNWSGSAWVNSRRWTYTYDTSGCCVNFLWEVWTNGAWVNYGRSIITNDASGRETYSLQQAWYDGAWVNYEQHAFTYDGSGREATDLCDTWENNAWVHSTLNSFTYNVNGNKTDELEQAWKDNAWVNSTWYIDSWVEVSANQIQVMTPATAEVVLAGAPYDIKWKSAGVDSVTLEFSLDGGTTFTRLVRSVPASSGQYYWAVPDTLSAKCRIRISDLADSAVNALSNQFRIKGYILTRFKANGDYEPFDPKVHGWRFSNAQTNMWPQSWFRKFDYAIGYDPYTAQRYQYDIFRAPPVWAWFQDFPDWPLFVKAFSIDTCYVDPAAPVYSPRAIRYWCLHKGNWGGSCFGFAVSSLLDFDFPQAFRAYYPALGTFGNVHDLPINDSTRQVINELFLYQFGSADLAFDKQQRLLTPQQTLQDLKTELLSQIHNHSPMVLRNQIGRGAHEVVPYKLVRNVLTQDTYFDVYLYDSNCPDGDCYGGGQSILTIDSTTNSWFYEHRAGTMEGIYLDAPANTYLNRPVFLFDSTVAAPSAPVLGKRQAPGSYIQLLNSTTGSVVITNPAGGSIGCHDSTIFNTFSDGIPIVPATSTFQPPIGYYIPDDSYSIRMSAFQDSIAMVSAFGSSTVFSYWRMDALTNQSDILSYSNGIACGNPDTQVKKVNLEAIISANAGEHQMQVLNCLLAENDSLQMNAPDTSMLEFVNLGQQRVYDLNIVLAGRASHGHFTHTGISIPAHSTHYILPSWHDLPHQPVKIYEDIGNTGSIHDTLVVINQLTGVGEQLNLEIPHEFRLEQNYPNPFNPTTVVSCQLPVASRLKIAVYDILGREVAILMDERKEAGRYQVTWDASGFASGVYIYRLTAGEYVQSKRMLLLR
jgi:hypothetical protein